MRVVVTGSAGRLGRVVVRELVTRGHAVTAIDRIVDRDPGSLNTTVGDLRDPKLQAALFDGIEAVVHCAAIPWDHADTTALIRDNLDLSAALACKARQVGVTRFIHVSSIQVIASERPGTDESARVAGLPLDGNSPPRPANDYAWCKLGAEVAVRAALAGSDVQCVILRLPWLVDSADPKQGHRSLRALVQPERACVVEQGFSYLAYTDAASLIATCLERDLPGTRVYLPAVCAVAPEAIGQYLERYYPGVSVRGPATTLSSLIDLEPVTRETGWRPAHVIRLTPPPTPSRWAWLARLVRRHQRD